jgi:hypothetical protein
MKMLYDALVTLCLSALVLNAGAQTLNINFPKAQQTFVLGVTPNGNMCGYYIDQGGVQHGFTKSGSTWQKFEIDGEEPLLHSINWSLPALSGMSKTSLPLM